MSISGCYSTSKKIWQLCVGYPAGYPVWCVDNTTQDSNSICNCYHHREGRALDCIESLHDASHSSEVKMCGTAAGVMIVKAFGPTLAQFM